MVAVFVAVFSPAPEHTGSDPTSTRPSPSPTTTDGSGSPGAPTTNNTIYNKKRSGGRSNKSNCNNNSN